MTTTATRKKKAVRKPYFMDETAKRDKKEARAKSVGDDIKDVHALSSEAQKRLMNCRLDTSTHDAIVHDVTRVNEICKDLQFKCKSLLRRLGK